MKHDGGGKGGSPRAQGKQDIRRDRKSGTGMSGSPKKGGHGGKFTWAGDASYAEEEIEARRRIEADSKEEDDK
uniref:Programmed cell death protein 4-like n=1 Tax=Kalanchoe fedtschenkoi TaxID=63787 RepID=A0A7N0UEW9_KALFE